MSFRIFFVVLPLDTILSYTVLILIFVINQQDSFSFFPRFRWPVTLCWRQWTRTIGNRKQRKSIYSKKNCCWHDYFEDWRGWRPHHDLQVQWRPDSVWKQRKCSFFVSLFKILLINLKGQLGLGSNTHQNVPKLLMKNLEIKQVALGGKHSVLYSKNGDVFVFGRFTNIHHTLCFYDTLFMTGTTKVNLDLEITIVKTNLYC